jgi:hypothetical protein
MALQAAGISCRIDSYPAGSKISNPREYRRGDFGRSITLGVYVRPLEAGAAAKVGADFNRELVPDAVPQSSGKETQADACPGCGVLLPADAAVCPACGLSILAE